MVENMKKKIAGSQEFMDGLPEHLKKTMTESQKEILSEYFTQYLEVIGGRYKNLMQGLRDEFKKRPDLPTSKLTQIRDIKRERTPILDLISGAWFIYACLSILSGFAIAAIHGPGNTKLYYISIAFAAISVLSIIYLLIKSFFKSDSVNVSNTTVMGDFAGRDLITTKRSDVLPPPPGKTSQNNKRH